MQTRSVQALRPYLVRILIDFSYVPNQNLWDMNIIFFLSYFQLLNPIHPTYIAVSWISASQA